MVLPLYLILPPIVINFVLVYCIKTLVSFFCVWIFSYPNICWKHYCFPHCFVLAFSLNLNLFIYLRIYIWIQNFIQLIYTFLQITIS
jgi:hypothetical protein